MPPDLRRLRPAWPIPWVLLVAVLLLTAVPAGAQEWHAGYLFERLAGDQGLSDATVFSVVDDRDGFLWFATADGLNRFNGYEFAVYRHDEATPGTISANGIGSIMVDSRGTLWVGTWGGGLNPARRRRGAV